ncbi:hypothetical protein AHAS_Ahas11G0146500 [Arachis hypogaea]
MQLLYIREAGISSLILPYFLYLLNSGDLRPILSTFRGARSPSHSRMWLIILVCHR